MPWNGGSRPAVHFRTELAQRTILDRYAETLEALAPGEIRDLPTWDPFP
jgi:hypothetical protein